MQPNDVARKFARKFPGYHLIDFAVVALPVFVLSVDAIVIAEKSIPIVDEFILRSIYIGIVSRSDLSGFMGLEERYLNERIAGLINSDHLYYKRSDDSESASICLTRRGEDAVKSALLIQPKREKVEISIDGITRRPIGRNNLPLLTGYNVRSFGIQDIRPFPNRAPNLDEVGLPDTKFIRIKSRRPDHSIQRLLETLNVSQKKRRYREAIMLVFKSDVGEELQVWFAIDGRRAHDVEDAFATNDGIRALRINEQVKAAREEVLTAIYDLDFEDIRRKADSEQSQVRDFIIPVTEKLEKLYQEELNKTQTLESGGSDDEVVQLRVELNRILAEKAALEESIANIEVRHLEVHEHRPFFDRALEGAQKRLLIVSPWINDYVMGSSRLSKIEMLLKNGVKVYIGYGIGNDADRRPKDEGKIAIDRLNRLMTVYPNLVFQRLGDTHAKVLLVDDLFAIIGSFNWMSFDGSARRAFREEISYYVAIKPKIDEFFGSYLGRFGG